MARFVLLAGKYVRGSSKEGNRVIVSIGEAFDTKTDKEAAYCRKYPENFREVVGPLPIHRGKVVDTAKSQTTEPTNNPDVEEIDIDTLKAMSARDLLSFAREHGISVTSTKKEDIIKDIEKALSTE